MQKIQKFILPLLVVLVLGLVYIFYLSPQRGLGTFDDIDPDAHVQKEIKVKLLADEGINTSSDGTKAIFYVKDVKGRRVEVAAGKSLLPNGFEQADLITIVGHFHGPRFDAVEVNIE
jgi:hypothetical protein